MHLNFFQKISCVHHVVANNNKYDKTKTNMETGSTVTKMFHKFVDLTDKGLNYIELDFENMNFNFLERPSFINVSVSAGTSFECGNLSEDYSIPVTNVTDSKGWIGEDNDGHRGYYLFDNNSNLYLFTKLFTYNGQKMPFRRTWNENKTKCHFESIIADLGGYFNGFFELFDQNEEFQHLCTGFFDGDSITTGTGKTMYIDILNPTTGDYDQQDLTDVEITNVWSDFGVYQIYSSQLSTYFPGKTSAYLFYEKTMIAPTNAIKYGNYGSDVKPNDPCVVNVRFNTESDLAARYQNSVLYL